MWKPTDITKFIVVINTAAIEIDIYLSIYRTPKKHTVWECKITMFDWRVKYYDMTCPTPDTKSKFLFGIFFCIFAFLWYAQNMTINPENEMLIGLFFKKLTVKCADV